MKYSWISCPHACTEWAPSYVWWDGMLLTSLQVPVCSSKGSSWIQQYASLDLMRMGRWGGLGTHLLPPKAASGGASRDWSATAAAAAGAGACWHHRAGDPPQVVHWWGPRLLHWHCVGHLCTWHCPWRVWRWSVHQWHVLWCPVWRRGLCAPPHPGGWLAAGWYTGVGPCTCVTWLWRSLSFLTLISVLPYSFILLILFTLNPIPSGSFNLYSPFARLPLPLSGSLVVVVVS